MDPLRLTHLCCALVLGLAPSGAAHASASLDPAPAGPSAAALPGAPAPSLPPPAPAEAPTVLCTPIRSGAGAVVTFFNAPAGTTVECGTIKCRFGVVAVTAFAASGVIEARAEGACTSDNAPTAVSTAPVPDADAVVLVVVFGTFSCVATALADGTSGTAACGSP